MEGGTAYGIDTFGMVGLPCLAQSTSKGVYEEADDTPGTDDGRGDTA